jgi:hypothetical protein
MIPVHAEASRAAARPRGFAAAFAAISGALLASVGCQSASTFGCNAGCGCSLTEESCLAAPGCFAGYLTLPDGGQGAFLCSGGPILPPNCHVIAVALADGAVTQGCADAGDAD